ncbi:MAG: fibronectin type III domain-containing protein [Patescibacteria group bacterium]
MNPDQFKNLDRLDQELARIQRSTKTSWRFFAAPHDWLRMKFRWYYKWHLNPWAQMVHKFSFGLVTAGILLIVLTQFGLFDFNQSTKAAAVSVDTSTTGEATNNSSQRKTFTDTVNNTQWAFYNNGEAIEYSYSSDGSSWVSAGTLAHNTQYFSTNYKAISGAGYVLLATECNTYDVCIYQGSLTGTSISFGSAATVFDGVSLSNNYSRPTVTYDGDNYIWVGAVKDFGNSSPDHLQAQTKKSSSANNISGWGSVLTAGNKMKILTNVIILNQSGSSMYLVASNGSSVTGFKYTTEVPVWTSANDGGEAAWFEFGDGGFSAAVNAVAISGTDVYVGGSFIKIDSLTTNFIAKWNGSSWSTLGSGVGGPVYALEVVGTDLYVGGSFNSAGAVAVNNLAKFNTLTSEWSSVGGGVVGVEENSAIVYSLIESNSSLYIGGSFVLAGETSAKSIAKWDIAAESWSALGNGLIDMNDSTAIVRSIAIDGSSVYAGGMFVQAGEVAANVVAVWDGNSWSSMGSPQMDMAMTVAIYNSEVYIGGLGWSEGNAAKWNGSAWEYINFTSEVRTLVVNDGKLYAGGGFQALGEDSFKFIAVYNGVSWSGLEQDLNNTVSQLTFSGNDLYTVGSYTAAGTVAAKYFAKYSDGQWQAQGSVGGIDGDVNTIAVDDSNNIYIGGTFRTAGGISANRIAKYDGDTWSALGTGTSGEVKVIKVVDDIVYVGGSFASAGGEATSNIASWNPATSTWSALGSGTDSTVYTLADFGSSLYAGGNFSTAGGGAASKVATWNMTAGTWSALGSGVNDLVLSVATDPEGNLYVGGSFTSPGSKIAKWNGLEWSALGTGVNNLVRSLIFVDSKLYVSGHFTTAGGVSSNLVAMWDGENWNSMGLAGSVVYTIAADASNNIYASVPTNGNRSAQVKWNGEVWDNYSNGFAGSGVYSSLFIGDRLYIGGSTTVFSSYGMSGTSLGYLENAIARSTDSGSEVSAVTDSLGNIHLAYSAWYNSGRAMYSKHFDASTSRWGIDYSIGTEGSQPSPSIAVNPSNNDIYVFLIASNNSVKYYKWALSTDPEVPSSWELVDNIYSTGTNTGVSVSEYVSGYKLGMIWTNGTGSPYTVYADSLNFITYGTLSGTVYTDRTAATHAGAGVQVRLVIDGTLNEEVATTDENGAYSFVTEVGTNDNVLIFADPSAGNIYGNVVMTASGADLTGIDIYGNAVIARNETASQVTNETFQAAHGSLTETGILYSSGLPIDSSVDGTYFDLLVWPGKSMTASADVRVEDLVIGTGATLSGMASAGENAFMVSGDFVNNGTFVANQQKLIVECYEGFCNGSSSQIVTTGGTNATFYDIDISKQIGDSVIIDGDLKITHDLNVIHGTIDLLTNTPDIDLSNDLYIYTNGDMTTMPGDLTFLGDSESELRLMNSDVFSHIIIGGGEGKILSLITSSLLADTFTINAGNIFKPPYEATATINVNWENYGTLDTSSGNLALVLEGSAESKIYGNNTFSQFYCTTPDKTIKFESGKTQNITGALNITGTSGHNVVLAMQGGTSGVDFWNIDPDTSSRTVDYVKVTDSTNLDEVYIDPPNYDPESSHTVNWFPAAPTVTTGAKDSYLTTDFSSDWIEAKGSITATGGKNPTIRGLKYSTVGEQDDSSSFDSGDYSTGDFTKTLSNLEVNTLYYIRAYATNTGGTGYGSWISMYTKANTPGISVAGDYDEVSGYHLDATISPNLNSDGTEYYLQYSTDGTNFYDPTGMAWGQTEKSYIFTTDKDGAHIQPYTQYWLKVKARNGDNIETDYSSSSADVTPPAAPTITNPAVSNICSTTATVSWTASVSGDKYDLSYGTDASASNTAVINNIATTSYELTNLVEGDKYYFKVRAVSNANGTGAYSSISDPFTPTACVAPIAPNDFSGTPASASSIDWSWTDSSTIETGYKVHNLTHSSLSGDLPADSIAWSEQSLEVNTAYTRHVNIFNEIGNNDSNSATVYTKANTPGQPSVNQIDSISLKVIVSEGTDNPSYTHYEIYETTTGKYVRQSDGTLQATEDWQTYSGWGGASGITINGLDSNTSYTFQVRAANKAAMGLDNVLTDWSASTTNSTYPKYSITISIDGTGEGTVSPSAVDPVNRGTSVDLTASPSINSNFTTWTGCTSVSGNVCHLSNITSDKSVTATFAIKTFTVQISKAGNGASVSDTSPNTEQTVNYDGSIDITALPHISANFTSWSGCDSVEGAVCHLTNITSNKSVTATFAIKTFTVAATSTGCGSVSNSSQAINYGSDSAVMTFIPNSGCYVFNVVADGDSVGSPSSKQFTNITQNHTVDVEFREYPTATLSINSGSLKTNQDTVSLSITHNTTALEMKISNSSDLTGAEYTPVRSSISNWILADSSNDGVKTVYLKVKDSVGHESGVVSATISLDKTPTDAPLNLVAVGGKTTTSLSWKNPVATDFTKMAVFRSTSPNFIPDLGANKIGDTRNNLEHSYIDTNVANGVLYYYRIKAVDDADNYSISSNEASAKADNDLPSAPGLPTITEKTNSIDDIEYTNRGNNTITWPASTDLNSGLKHYSIMLTIPPLASNNCAETTTANSLTCNFSDGIYSIAVQAHDNTGNSSAFSQTLYFNVDTSAPTLTEPLSISDAPTDRSALDYKALLSWSKASDGNTGGISSGILGYIVYRYEDPILLPNQIVTKVSTDSSGNPSYVDAITPDKNYDYSVLAVDKAMNRSSKISNSINVAGILPGEGELIISDITSTPSDQMGEKTFATISWKTSVPSTSMVSYGLDTGYSLQSPLDTGLNTIHTMVLSDLEFSKTYHFKVFSEAANGDRANSDDYTFTTKDILKDDDVWSVIPGVIIRIDDVISRIINEINVRGTAQTVALPVASSAAVVAASGAAAAAAPIANAMTLFSFPEYLRALLYSILSIGSRRKRREWGKVVEEGTGIPIAQARLSLIRLEKNIAGNPIEKIVATTYSDKKGNYAFIAEKGSYRLSVDKDLYKVSNLKDVYHPSDVIKVKEDKEGLIIPSIVLSMDSHSAKKKLLSLNRLSKFEKVLFYVSLVFLIFGTYTSILNLLANPRNPLNFLIIIYPILWVVTLASLFKVSPWGNVVDKTNSQGVSLALVRIMDKGGKVLVKTAITDQQGKYQTTVPKGEYKILVAKQGYFQAEPETLNATNELNALNKQIEVVQRN